ncbi:ribosomal protein L29 [Desulfurobacterium thermolithotrophum DSM 11699]|uniref:Large ribosomal subunit protein uL29 n=1 Tax=Desulfurobacterium thermolithotrophum (strain DSM 11699 / BSA) TaxID=868864 RepID=F0S1C8_DESTD|nr:50S ribosomal protein L29 [Desulfurobacterium thermolithotrophum]ADY72859.1 ribosomal protein L29 [Desulfurobacterium thermolithotrophum DSM 11699]
MKKYTEELRQKSTDELKKMVVELKEKLLKLRFKNAFGQLENPMEIRKTRKQIARIFTILRERGVKA